MSLSEFKMKGQLGPHSKCQASQGYTVRPCLKTNKPKQQKSHRQLLNPEMGGATLMGSLPSRCLKGQTV